MRTRLKSIISCNPNPASWKHAFTSRKKKTIVPSIVRVSRPRVSYARMRSTTAIVKKRTFCTFDWGANIKSSHAKLVNVSEACLHALLHAQRAARGLHRDSPWRMFWVVELPIYVVRWTLFENFPTAGTVVVKKPHFPPFPPFPPKSDIFLF
jgi:hypothetical protein